jgi:thioredoxin-related protein
MIKWVAGMQKSVTRFDKRRWFFEQIWHSSAINKKMKRLVQQMIFWLLSVALLSSWSHAALPGWTSDFEQAKERAQKENKMLLVEFTGSDWCPPCMRMRQQVFSKKSFLAYASRRFVLVELDFPMRDPELKKKNDVYARQFRIEGMPMIVLLDQEGKEFERFFASDYPTEKEFVRHLDQVLQRREGR